MQRCLTNFGVYNDYTYNYEVISEKVLGAFKIKVFSSLKDLKSSGITANEIYDLIKRGVIVRGKDGI